MIPNDNPDMKGQPGIAEAALFGLCPKCRAETVFEAIAVIAPKCTSCGLDFVKLGAKDGRGAFLTLIIWAVLVVMAMALESFFGPPLWVHAIIWIPATTGAVFFGLRAAKISMLYDAYRTAKAGNDAEAGT